MGRQLTINGLGKRFGNVEILRDVSLEVESGEFVTLLGPSGCGKSTLLRLIAGLDTPDAGEIRIGSVPLNGLAPKMRDVAMVFQSYALYPHMSVRQNIAIPLMMSRLSFLQRLPLIGRYIGGARAIWSGIEKDVQAVATQLELDTFLERRPSQLSGGQRQRVAVGRAMVRQPAVFLMDEPLSNLDARLRLQLRDEISELHRRTGITFIFVTHDQTEAMALSDRIAIMDEGRIVQFGSPDDIYRRPARLSVARFIGTTPINILPVDVEERGDLVAAGVQLGLRAPSVGNGSYRLGVRPESIELVSAEGGGAHFALPVVRTERLGAEVILRLDGARLGSGPVRVQLRAETFNTQPKYNRPGEMAWLRITCADALLFDSLGVRIDAGIVDAGVAAGGSHAAFR
ncbi:ABC transporter ATP-binding protein [Agrobacterium sp. BT-220-3]|nr:ABC transporter ATP-binding protein [Agrobacterium sp. BT-220-3]